MAITGGFGFKHDTETGLSRKWVIGNDGVKRWHDSGEPVDACDIPLHLRRLADHMKDVATRMDYYGGFDGEMKAKAAELLNASIMAEEWADSIEIESEEAIADELDKAIDENPDLVQPITDSEMNSMQSMFDDIQKIEEEARETKNDCKTKP